MKRGGYIKRKTALRSGGSLKRTAMKRRAPRKRAGNDPAYRRFITGFDCCAPQCEAKAPSHPHHHSLTGERGTAQKPHDSYCMPLCFVSHRDLHSLSGPFKGWSKAQLKDWQDERVAHFRSLYSTGNNANA